MKALVATLTLICTAPAWAPAEILWIELTQGDISDDRFAPTAFTLAPGDNYLFGIIDGDDGAGNIDRDYFSIVVPAGHQLTHLSLDDYASVDFAAFMGIQPGPVFPDDPELVRPEDLLGWTLFGPSDMGHDLLPLMGANGQGFSPPLPAGVYSFWVQQLDYYTEWAGNFVVETPEPGPACGLLLVGLTNALRRRR